MVGKDRELRRESWGEQKKVEGAGEMCQGRAGAAVEKLTRLIQPAPPEQCLPGSRRAGPRTPDWREGGHSFWISQYVNFGKLGVSGCYKRG